MLALGDPSWSNLQHAYGSASDIPTLLAQLDVFPDDSAAHLEPWQALWSALCHQGDVYAASFAAVPHMVAAISLAPERATYNYFLLPACIEIARVARGVEIPAVLEEGYLSALGRLPLLAARANRPGCSVHLCASALAASAAASGHHAIASLLIDVGPDDINAVLEWILDR